jgi:hypothetical protein
MLMNGAIPPRFEEFGVDGDGMGPSTLAGLGRCSLAVGGRRCQCRQVPIEDARTSEAITMTSTTALSTREPVRADRPSWVYVRELWAAVAISLMWLAVLFVGVYGGDAVFTGTDGSSTRLPSSVFVAFFAFLATVAVGKRAFESKRTRADDHR